MLSPNTILQNRYRIVRLLGQGGMGAVYEAIDQRVSCVVALKETLVGANNEAREAFQREAALLANLRHASLPKVMDFFGEADGEFLVMEYIAGHDLAELLELRASPFPQQQVLGWADELLKLLEYLHTREPPILHRDIKPANLKVTSQGEVFLLDFGLAKGAAGQMATIQTSRSVHGFSPVYAPLEQIHGRGTDPRSDLYSLAATLYHLLTGQAPLGAPTRFDVVEGGRPDPLKPANKLNSLVTSRVAELVQSAMALSRHDRFSSAAEMRLALATAARESADGRSVREEAEAALISNQPERSEDDSVKPLITDKDVQFTVYAPQKIKPEKMYPMLAFAHLSKRRDDAAEDERDPIEEMKDQAARILGNQRDDYRDDSDSSRQEVPRGGELTFVPIVQGLTFSPPSRSFNWRKNVHREEFDLWASREVDGQTLNGRMTIFLGSVIIAEVELTVSVDSRASSSAERISLDKAQSARRVRQVFASYSHRDEQIVAELAHVAPLFGSRFLMDRTHLEPGEDRREGLQRLIQGADAFQLFWSTNSMRSPEVRSEMDYAISLRRPNFILPTYWEEPVPRSSAEGLPPPEIEHLHFYRIYPGVLEQIAFAGIAESRQHTAARDTAPTVAAPPASLRDETPARALPALPQTSDVSYSRARRKILMPILAAAAFVLVAVVVTPVWFMMSRSSRLASNTSSANDRSSNPSNRETVSGFTNKTGIEFVLISPGSFRMGSTSGEANEKRVHPVTINYKFYMGKYEVTQAQWQAMMGDNPSFFKDCGNCPVEQVSWDDAQKFIQRLNGMKDGNTYHLPTEAEWEYACRAGTTGDYAGDDLSEMAWYRANSGNKTHEVGQKQANEWGLADLNGNVWEWCEDWYHETYNDAPTDGGAWLSGGKQKERVLRGGSWASTASQTRSAFRNRSTPAYRGYSFGFRVVAVR